VQQIGLNVPVLNNPGTLISLLTGHNVALFTNKLPSLNVSWSAKPLLGTYVFMVGPIPVTVSVFADVGVSAYVNSAGRAFGNEPCGVARYSRQTFRQ
jgi:hypothetical protein